VKKESNPQPPPIEDQSEALPGPPDLSDPHTEYQKRLFVDGILAFMDFLDDICESMPTK